MESKEKNKSQVEIHEDHKKIMIIGITVIMAVVASLWAFNVKSFINPYSEKLVSTEQEKLDWKDVKERFDKTMSSVVNKMNEFDSKKEAAANAANASSSLDNLEDNLKAKIGQSDSSSTSISTSSTSSLISTSSTFQSGELKDRLEDIEKNLQNN